MQSEQPGHLGSVESLQPSSAATPSLHSNNNVHPSQPQAGATKKGLLNRFINSELGRTFISLVFFIVVCIGMAFCNQFSDHRWVTTDYTNVLLEDRGFDIFPALKSNTSANIFVMTSIVFTVIGMALICPNWTERGIILRRVFWVVGILSVYRALTLSVTTMPTPKEHCDPATARGFGPMFWIALQMIPGTVEACTDDIFSGHTVFMVTSAIQWRLYCKNKWITYFTYIYITIGLYFVVATRLHYSVDVILAIFITYGVWSLYIGMIDVVMEKEYFGLNRHREKYAVFDSRWSENKSHEQNQESEKECSVANVPESAATGFAARRAQLEYRMNRLRGPGIGYDRGEHDRVAFVPMQYNIWLTGAVRWCDGLDLRMRRADDDSSISRWEELIINRQSIQRNQSPSYQKAEIDDMDLEAGQAPLPGHGRDATIAPVMLQSIQVVGHSEGVSSGVGTQ
ncbi:hypothetical protein BGX21_011115 [Mortierella sp. AD011]|nr:hypothetical protein BGX20_001384 [Mortierella sp. AD010]KAF9391982.1 hypothetical protein BGX21_011115 [Mortierella sp. AD011]